MSGRCGVGAARGRAGSSGAPGRVAVRPTLALAAAIAWTSATLPGCVGLLVDEEGARAYEATVPRRATRAESGGRPSGDAGAQQAEHEAAAPREATPPLREPASGADPRLDLDRVLAIAARTFPALGVAEQERAITEARRLAALGAFDLRVKAYADWAPAGFFENVYAGAALEQPTGLYGARLEAGYRIGAGDFDLTYDGKRRTNHGGEVGVGLALPLLRGGAIDDARAGLYRADLRRGQADAEVRLREIRVRQEAARAFAAFAGAARRLEVAEALLGQAEARQEGIAVRALGGDVPAVEALDHERVVLERRVRLVAARRGFERAAIALGLFVRGQDGRPLRLDRAHAPAVLPAPAPCPAEVSADELDRALAARPELEALRLRVAEAAVDRALAANERLPQLDASVWASQDLDPDRPSETKGDFELEASLALALPLQQRRARGRLAESEARLAQLDLERAFAEDRILAELEDTHSALQAAYERFTQAAQAAALARRLAEAERRAFALGDSTVLVLNLREQAAAEAEATEVDAHQEWLAADADYRAALGEGVGDAGPPRGGSTPPRK